MRPFQVALLGGFAFLALAALFLLNNYSPSSSEEEYAYGDSVEIWGTLSEDVIENQITAATKNNPGLGVVNYTQKDERTFDDDLINALAEGNPPDLLLMPAGQLVKHRSKLLPIPYESFPVRDFKDAYIDAADIFMFTEGVYAIPFAMDPIILYWNRDLFSTKGLAQPAQTWEAMVTNIVPVLTERDSRRTILKSAIAFGEYRNVNNAEGIMLSLRLQSGSRMITEASKGYTVGLNSGLNESTKEPLTSSLQFYTDFSNPNSPLYSWNRSLPLDRNAFISGDLAVYFGFGSEVRSIAEKNPNLNFDVAVIPQGSGATVRRTYAQVLGFSIPKASDNVTGAYAVARLLASPGLSKPIIDQFGLTPVHRELLSGSDLNQYQRITHESAFFARDWLNPDVEASHNIFSVMIEDVVSNRARPSDSADDAEGRLRLQF